MSRDKLFATIRWVGFAVLGIGFVLMFITMLPLMTGRIPSVSALTSGNFLTYLPLGIGAALITVGSVGKSFQNPFAEKKLLTEGKMAMATLTDLQQTGTFVNMNPQVDMVFAYQLENGTSVSGTDRKILPVTHLSQYQIGAQYPIRYREEKPGVVALDFGGQAM